MNQFCVLMTLVFGHVLALSENDFKRHVNHTNSILKQLNGDPITSIITYFMWDSIDIERVTSIFAAPTSVYKDGEINYPDSLVADEEHIRRSMSTYGIQPGDLNINLNQLTLSGMGEDRRNKIKGTVSRLVEEVESDPKTAHFDVRERCRLIALLVNVTQPDIHIFYSRPDEVNGNDDCRLKYKKSDDKNQERVIVYRMWEDDNCYYEVDGQNGKGKKLTQRPIGKGWRKMWDQKCSCSYL
ncbi:uncharacterized protein LOC126836371 [Adelges cooleyi]|uniref:uncharacterized protein LOC126836371 n=1 Tax=Adelges cooleyi TaxID=133065 RepID=UPI0021803959|nr:uncharacterized protein LOC126836371 [Adelges cooleyi]